MSKLVKPNQPCTLTEDYPTTPTHREASALIWNVKNQQAVAVVRPEIKTHSDSFVDVVADEFKMRFYCRESKRHNVGRLTNTHNILINMMYEQTTSPRALKCLITPTFSRSILTRNVGHTDLVFGFWSKFISMRQHKVTVSRFFTSKANGV